MGGDDLGDESFLVEEITADDNNEDEPLPKRRKREKTPEEILIETGRRIRELCPTEQAAFLNTAARHFGLKEESNDQLISEGLPLANFGSTEKEIIQEQWLLPTVKQDAGLKEAIRSVVSMKKLKHWKGKSPCVVSRCSFF